MHLPNLGYLFSFSAVNLFFLGWLVMYCGIMIWLISNYKRVEAKSGLIAEFFDVALIIPFRNEEKNMHRLARQLVAYIPSSWEIIWVDDHSEDSSLQVLTSWMGVHGNNRWKVLSAVGAGKKSALQTGISYSSAEIIITTDADVILRQHAFRHLLLPFTDHQIQLVAGPVISNRELGIFARFQQIEWASILLVTGASFTIGLPLMCSGANLAFRKQAFIEVKGYQGNEKLLSGDDEFLLKKITARFGSSAAVFLANEKSLVFVSPAQSIGELLQQRIRWASKWKVHNSIGHAASAASALIFTVLPYFSLLFYFTGDLSGWLLGIFWIGRFICDKVILGKVLSALHLNSTWLDYLLADIIHPGYVFAVGLGVLRGGFVWKGRKSKLFH